MNKLLYLLGFLVFFGMTVNAQNQINRAEYFFDTDPGVGNGIAIPVTQGDTVLKNLTVSTQGLSVGYHYVWVRTQDELDQWSIYHDHLFYVYDSTHTSVLISQPQITAAEYFIDTDPGVGNGTPITITPGDTVLENFTFNTGSLPAGFHYIWIRTKTLNGKWSIYDEQLFYIYDPTFTDETVTQAQITGAEYFIDTDPGVGNGTPINVSAGDTIMENLNIDLASYQPGSYMLYVRTVDANGRWSLHQRKEFDIVDCSLPTAEFSVASQVCLDESLSFTDNSSSVDPAATYEWDIGNDGTVEYTTVGDITNVFSTAGTYEVLLTVINEVGCSDEYIQTVEVVDYSEITETQSACNSYTWPGNGTTYSSSGQYTETFSSSLGCDSIVTLDLTIQTPTSGTDIVEACESFTWMDGNTYTASNTTATHTLTNVAGCDSVVTLDLTIHQPNSGTDVVITCVDYTWIDGNTYSTSNNTATHTLLNAFGCDSLVTLDLTIQSFVTGTDVIATCDSYTWIDGNTYNSSNNTATHTLTSVDGCDSIVSLDLTIGQPTNSVDEITTCGSYDWIDGNTYYSSNNTATHTMTSVEGCDSIVNLDLTINQSTSSSDVVSACDSYDWIDGNTYTSNNNSATHILTNAAGCDSTVTLNLTITSIDAGVTDMGDGVLKADENGANYQWLDCDNNMAAINGETDQQFEALTDGKYAVEVTKNNCSDVSDCITVDDLKIEDQSALSEISIYPNPTSGEVYVDLGKIQNVDIELFTIEGKLLMKKKTVKQSTQKLEIKAPKGIYIIKVKHKATSKRFKVVKMR